MATGWARDVEDFAYLAKATARSFAAPGDFTPPPSMSFRNVLKVEQQGAMSSCVGHGGSSGMECLQYLSNRGKTPMSRMAMYLLAQRVSGIRGDSGATIAGCVKAQADTGCPTEDVMPYPSRYSNKLPAEVVTAANTHKILGHQELTSYQQVFNWISQGKGPVIFGMSWFQRVQNTNGIITAADLGGRDAGGHCMLFAGYQGGKDSSGRYFIDQINSHGTEWGDGGWAQWEPDAVEKLCQQERGQASVIGITDITGFDAGRIIDFSKVV